MKIRIKNCTLFLIMLYASNLLGTYVIDTPGIWRLTTDFADSGDVISIVASGVTLEMNARRIIGGNHALVIESGVQGTVIQNGSISGTAQSAILVKDGAGLVQLSNVKIASCGGPAIEILGTTTGIANVFIDGAVIIACSLSVTSSHIISAEYADNVVIRNSQINLSGNLSNTINLVRFKNCMNSAVLNCLLIDSFGASLRGVLVDNSRNCFFSTVRVVNDRATTGTFTGFLVTNTSVSNLFDACQVLTCSSLANDAVGFQIDSDSSKNILRGCNVISLEGENVYGMYVKGTGTPSGTLKNSIVDSSVVTNSARSGDVAGILISRADASTIGQCRFSYNVAPLGNAVGILFQLGTGGNHWNVHENKIVQNSGSSDANSYGISLDPILSTSNVFIKNISSENGANSANQLAGLAANSISLTTPDLVNTITLPWTNIGVAS